MGLERFWRCDSCGKDTTASDPPGWRLTGRHLYMGHPATAYDLYLCSHDCAASYFIRFAAPEGE